MTQTIYIHVTDGVAEIASPVPPKVSIEIIDFDTLTENVIQQAYEEFGVDVERGLDIANDIAQAIGKGAMKGETLNEFVHAFIERKSLATVK